PAGAPFHFLLGQFLAACERRRRGWPPLPPQPWGGGRGWGAAWPPVLVLAPGSPTLGGGRGPALVLPLVLASPPGLGGIKGGPPGARYTRVQSVAGRGPVLVEQRAVGVREALEALELLGELGEASGARVRRFDGAQLEVHELHAVGPVRGHALNARVGRSHAAARGREAQRGQCPTQRVGAAVGERAHEGGHLVGGHLVRQDRAHDEHLPFRRQYHDRPQVALGQPRGQVAGLGAQAIELPQLVVATERQPREAEHLRPHLALVALALEALSARRRVPVRPVGSPFPHRRRWSRQAAFFSPLPPWGATRRDAPSIARPAASVAGAGPCQ